MNEDSVMQSFVSAIWIKNKGAGTYSLGILFNDFDMKLAQ